MVRILLWSSTHSQPKSLLKCFRVAMAAAKAAVFARVRPHARQGGHAARRKGEQPARKDVKQLGRFDHGAVTMHGGGGEHEFSYMDGVILPQDDQRDTYAAVGMEEMLDRFLEGYNSTFLAYGQTGTGKTHTMFGSQLDRLGDVRVDSGEMPEMWGLFPRALMSAIARLKVVQEKRRKKSIVEFSGRNRQQRAV